MGYHVNKLQNYDLYWIHMALNLNKKWLRPFAYQGLPMSTSWISNNIQLVFILQHSINLKWPLIFMQNSKDHLLTADPRTSLEKNISKNLHSSHKNLCSFSSLMPLFVFLWKFSSHLCSSYERTPLWTPPGEKQDICWLVPADITGNDVATLM